MFEGELSFRIDRVMPEFQDLNSMEPKKRMAVRQNAKAHPLHENEGVEPFTQKKTNGMSKSFEC